MFIDAIVASGLARDARLPLDPEAERLAGIASYKESFLAVLIIEANIRDATAGMVARLNSEDLANGRPAFSWLGRD